MRLATFQQLSFTQKTEVTESAVCLRGRRLGDCLLLLYQLDGFYIEVHYHRSRRSILAVEGFDDMTRLDPYLAEMTVYLPV